MIYLTIASFLINAVIGFMEFTIGLRIALKMIAANTRAPFVAWVYRVSEPFIEPFKDIFPTVGLGPSVVEPAALTAFIVYGIACFIINWVITRTQEHLKEKKKEDK